MIVVLKLRPVHWKDPACLVLLVSWEVSNCLAQSFGFRAYVKGLRALVCSRDWGFRENVCRMHDFRDEDVWGYRGFGVSFGT